MTAEPSAPEHEVDQRESESPVADLSYQQAAEELDAIINGLDSGAVDIDTLSEQFRRAIDLIEELDRRINVTRQQVERLTPRLDAISGANPDE